MSKVTEYPTMPKLTLGIATQRQQRFKIVPEFVLMQSLHNFKGESANLE